MNIVKPGFEREIYRQLRQNKMRKLLIKIERQFALDYLQEAISNMVNLVDQSKCIFEEDIGYGLASLYYKIGDFKAAMKVLCGIHPQENQKTPRVLNIKGMCSMRLNKLKEAAEQFEMCILIDPCYVNSMNNLGNLAMNSKDYDKCKIYYCKSKESNPLLI